MRTCLITVDVEEWFQVENLKSSIDESTWNNQESSLQKNIKLILSVCKKNNIKATFFVLGWIAEHHPDIIQQISNYGHEIASHGYGHQVSHELDKNHIREDINKSKILLEDIIGEKVIGYRAPSFSINDDVIEILSELGFQYDSSYNPFQIHGRYGTLQQSKINNDSAVKLKNGLFEIPVSAYRIFKFNVPISGGAYFRIMPFPIFKALVKKQIKKESFYNFYLHPWEFDPDQPRVKNLRWDYKIRHYTNLHKTERRFKKLIKFLKNQECEFLTIKDYLSKYHNLTIKTH